ncbi:MAG TPA: HtaA domain-containing protein [Solirubrobacterales bacterium]|nr:HtaA domain-containing protein [Solirubrobacterales bacterium]
MRRGAAVLAVIGVALLGAAPAGAKVRSVAGDGVVKVGQVRCGPAPCTLRAPARVRVPIGGQAFRAKVVVPRRIAAHAVASVRVKLGAAALKKLAGASAQVRVRVVVRAAGAKKVSVARARIARPASAEPGPGGGGGPGSGGPSGAPASTPIEGEPPLLARPATAVTVGAVTLSWMPRDSWVRYVSSGVGANDGVVPGGGATGVAATSSPCPDRPSSSTASLNYTVNFPAKESWYDPLSGEAGIYGGGSVAFRYVAHTINLTAAEPEIEINGAASRAIFRFSGSGGTPYPNQRVALETLETAGRPTVSGGGKTLTYNLMRGKLTEDGEKVFAGFYTAPGDNEFGCVSASFTLP